MFLATNVARASVLCPIYARRYRPDRSYRLGRLLGRLRQTFHGTRKEEVLDILLIFNFTQKRVGHYAITIMLILAWRFRNYDHVVRKWQELIEFLCFYRSTHQIRQTLHIGRVRLDIVKTGQLGGNASIHFRLVFCRLFVLFDIQLACVRDANEAHVEIDEQVDAVLIRKKVLETKVIKRDVFKTNLVNVQVMMIAGGPIISGNPSFGIDTTNIESGSKLLNKSLVKIMHWYSMSIRNRFDNTICTFNNTDFRSELQKNSNLSYLPGNVLINVSMTWNTVLRPIVNIQ